MSEFSRAKLKQLAVQLDSGAQRLATHIPLISRLIKARAEYFRIGVLVENMRQVANQPEELQARMSELSTQDLITVSQRLSQKLRQLS